MYKSRWNDFVILQIVPSNFADFCIIYCAVEIVSLLFRVVTLSYLV